MKDILTSRRQKIEQTLREELYRNQGLSPILLEAMDYSLLAGGKRLRPLLLMAASDALGVNGEKFLQTAVALEMIHTYSLIHDDLPAMDNDDYRRGKPTNHVKYGAGIATLAGDALLTLAFEVMTREKNSTAEVKLRVIQEISIMAGISGMAGGQAIDLKSQTMTLDLPTLQRMHMGKTGALFKGAIRAGALLAGATEKELAELTKYAENFGLAFQITDDILDVVGDEAKLGKSVGQDAKNNKSTYVSLASLAEAKSLAQKAVDEAKKHLDIFGEKGDFLRKTAENLLVREV